MWEATEAAEPLDEAAGRAVSGRGGFFVLARVIDGELRRHGLAHDDGRPRS